jgi:hypothetical protein
METMLTASDRIEFILDEGSSEASGIFATR